MSLHLSKCHIVGNHMSWLNYNKMLVAVGSVGGTVCGELGSAKQLIKLLCYSQHSQCSV